MTENICWRGPPGSGKRHALHQALFEKANQRGITLKIQTKVWNLEKPKETDEEDDDSGSSNKDQIPFESSIIHFGFDVSRMSLQDRHIIKPILERIGKGSHVITGKEKTEARILVFYHVHLLSTESCVILQSLLEQEGLDISIWCTSEHPLPIRIAHHFKEKGVGGKDRALLTLQDRIRTLKGDPTSIYDPQLLFDKALAMLARSQTPTLDEVAGIRAFIYECLIRNVRWIECVHHIMISLFRLPINEKGRLEALRVLAKQEGTASGQTIPSYRIPMAWENLFLQIREALSGSIADEDIPKIASLPPLSSTGSGAGSKTSSTAVDSRSTKRGGSALAKKGSA
jgi:hypothetical protein